MLTAQNISLSFGDRVVLNDLTFTLLSNERVALVGKNGAGKSSLLNIIAGQQPDAGSVMVSPKIKIGFLKQTPHLDDEMTVLDLVQSSMADHIENIKKHERLCLELGSTKVDDTAKLTKQIDDLAHAIEQHGGFDVDFQVERVLSRLGVKARGQKLKTLSGGELRRVDLARVLLSAPDIYLLDEPTNHLDIGGIKYLVETFVKSNASVLFISHDQAFTDEMATRILELANRKIYTHAPPFANYLEKKLVRDLIDQRTLHRRERLLVGELAWLRAGTPARTTKQNARIERAYDLMDQVAKDGATNKDKKISIDKTKSKRLGGTIMELNSVGAKFHERVLFSDLSMKVTSGQRYGIIGPNGAGKTTLLSMVAGITMPPTGTIVIGKNTSALRFDQQREVLDPQASIKETLADNGDYVTVAGKSIHIASYLEKYLFSPGDAKRRVKTLSGGEQNRLVLAKLFRTNTNCLLLDEPTNDLDLESLAILEEYLLEFEGVVFCVSHDRRFLDRICNVIISFSKAPAGSIAENTITIHHGNYSSFLKSDTGKSGALTKPKGEKKASTPKKERTKNTMRRTFKEEREFKEIEGKIETLEDEKKALYAELANPELFRSEPQKVDGKVARSKELDTQIETLYARWQELLDKDEN